MTIRGQAPVGNSSSAGNYTLPYEIVLFNIRDADCHPQGKTFGEWEQNRADLLKTRACSELEAERAELKQRYAGDPKAVDGLTLKWGYGGPFNYPAN